MVALDQAQALVMGVVIQDNEKSTEIAAFVLTNGLKDHNQIFVGQVASQGGDSLDEAHLLRPRIGGSGWRHNHHPRSGLERVDLEVAA